MKKTLAVILVAVLLLSTLVSLVVPAAAAEEGNWDVFLTATSVDEDEPEKNPPLPGYYYDETGFHSVSPDYTNYNPKFTVTSKQMYNIKDFSMTVVVHDYCPTNDNWLSFSIWSESNGISQGDTSGKYGDGWTSLIRSNPSTGEVNRFESWNMTKGGRSGKQVFSAIDNTQVAPIVFEPIIDEATGDFTITFAITNGVVSVNGTVIGAGTDKIISERFKEGLAYVAVTLNNTDNTGTYFPTISITDVNGSVPTGSDSRAAESKSREIAPIADPSTVPEHTPAIWFDGSLEATNKALPKGSNCEITYADDNKSMKVIANDALFYMQFQLPDDVSYGADDFSYIAFIFKNFCTCTTDPEANLNDVCANTETCNIWYYAGGLSSPGGSCVGPIASYYWVTPTDENGEATTTDYYTVAVFPVIHDEWTGRINGFRLDVSGFSNYGIDGMNSFDIVGCGIFATGADVTGYVKNQGYNTEWLEIDYPLDGSGNCFHIDMDEDGLCDWCFEEMEVETEIETETETEEVTTKAPETTTKAPETTTAATTTEETKSGCGATVSMSVLGLVALAGASMTCFKKKD